MFRLCLLVLLISLIFVSVRAQHTFLTPPLGNSAIRTLYGIGNHTYNCTTVPYMGSIWAGIEETSTLYESPTFESAPVGSQTSHSQDNVPGLSYTWSITAPDSNVTGLPVDILPGAPTAVVDFMALATSHNGAGPLANVSYIQRLNTSGGKPETMKCPQDQLATQISVPFNATYTFWQQDSQPPAADNLTTPSNMNITLSLFGSGQYNYVSQNGMWALKNVSGFLSLFPGSGILGKVEMQVDPTDSSLNAAWYTLKKDGAFVDIPKATPVDSFQVDPLSVNWTSFSREAHHGERVGLGAAEIVHMVSTNGGLPPTYFVGSVGEVLSSQFTAIFWFFGPTQHE